MAGHEARAKIRWNESTARDVQANTCRVLGSREEISLLFGLEKAVPADVQEETIQLTDRIILSPLVAKQLATALGRVISDYESIFGTIRKISRHATEEERKEKAAALFRLVKELNIEFGLEHSLKILDKTMLDNRFLLGFSKKEIEGNAQERIIHICMRLGMPPDLLETFRLCLIDANYVHFGFEEDATTCLYKVYVEFWESIRQEIQSSRNAARPFLLHLGFKWDAFDEEKKTVTRYTWHPWLSIPDIFSRLTAVVDPDMYGHTIEAAKGVVNIAAERISHKDILYIEVTEEGNPRKSFDINVYRAGLQLGELYPLLAKLGQHYAISHGEFHRLYDQSKTNRFGHLSAGVSREGKDFCTLYYGVEPVYGDKQRQLKRTGGSLIAPTGGPDTAPALPEQRVEKSDAAAAHLLEMVKNLHVPFGFERSFKILAKAFLPDRFLTGFMTKEMGPEQRENILGICQQIGMPDDFLQSFHEDLPQAQIALFGYERDKNKRSYKAYLEFSDRIQEAVRANPDTPRPFLMFIGFKWDASENYRKVITRYTCFPSLVLKDMADRAASLFYDGSGKNPYGIVEGILDLAANRAGPDEFLYFEAKEENTERKSFSINVYKAALRLAELYPLMLDMIKHYEVPHEQFHGFYQSARTQILGHVAGGMDREGRDFLTLYFSDKGSSGKSRLGISPKGTERRGGDGRQRD